MQDTHEVKLPIVLHCIFKARNVPKIAPCSGIIVFTKCILGPGHSLHNNPYPTREG